MNGRYGRSWFEDKNGAAKYGAQQWYAWRGPEIRLVRDLRAAEAAAEIPPARHRPRSTSTGPTARVYQFPPRPSTDDDPTTPPAA